NHFDIGIVFLPIKDDKLETRQLFVSQLALAVSVKHELAKIPSIRLKDLQKFPLFLLQKKYLVRQQIDNYCSEKGFILKPIAELSDMQSLLQMTILNNGATILPKSFFDTVDDDQIQQIPILDPISQKEVGIV